LSPAAATGAATGAATDLAGAFTVVLAAGLAGAGVWAIARPGRAANSKADRMLRGVVFIFELARGRMGFRRCRHKRA
jgi:hypothetical protein